MEETIADLKQVEEEYHQVIMNMLANELEECREEEANLMKLIDDTKQNIQTFFASLPHVVFGSESH
jgi:hypothetical protein